MIGVVIEASLFILHVDNLGRGPKQLVIDNDMLSGQCKDDMGY
jgi:hypothetical protein